MIVETRALILILSVNILCYIEEVAEFRFGDQCSFRVFLISQRRKKVKKLSQLNSCTMLLGFSIL
jgi:hypothetical protein